MADTLGLIDEIRVKKEKSTPPSKSSSEILSELFGQFNVKPPEISDTLNSKSEKSDKKHKKKKKHKEKKKKKSGKRNKSSSDENSDSSENEIVKKKNKKSKHKKRKRKFKSSDSEDDEIPSKKGSYSPINSYTKKTILDFKSDINDRKVTHDMGLFRIEVKNDSNTKDKIKSPEPVDIKTNSIIKNHVDNIPIPKTPDVSQIKLPDEVKTNVDVSNKPAENNEKNKSGTNKIQIKNLKFSSVYEATVKQAEEEARRKAEKYEDGEITESSDSESLKNVSDLDSEKDQPLKIDLRDKLNDMRNFEIDKTKSSKSEKSKQEKVKLLEKRLKRSRSKSKKRSRSRSRKRSRSRSRKRSSSRSRKRTRSRSSSRHRTHKRSRSRSHHRHGKSSRHRHDERDERRSSRYDRRRSKERDRIEIDKKRLLEIARKNAINMLQSGALPAAVNLGPLAQQKVLSAIKSGGKSVDELTDFCKNLSRQEALGELSSVSSDSENSGNEETRPFNHPFQVKDKAPIVLNIKGGTPLPTQSFQEKTIEQTKVLRLQFPVSSGTQHRGAEGEWRPVSPPAVTTKITSLPPLPKHVPNPPLIKPKVIPAITAPPETPPPVPPTPPLPAEVPATMPLPAIMPPLPPLVPGMVQPPIVPAVPPGPQVFPSETQTAQIDISSIVSQRLTAIRKLQQNPNDVSAISQMYQVNKEMSKWAQSKQEPGQFTGSTGAQILTPKELASGYQAWAKRDQLQTAAPVSGGMGMHLLQKMGWKPGEGLGKEKNGSLTPLLLEVKLDTKGLVAKEETKQRINARRRVPTVKTLAGKHPVSLLGEYCSKRKLGVPSYTLCFECGPDHKKNFLFKVTVNGVEYQPNVASANKKQAKADAAQLCLQKLGLIP